MPLLHQYNTIAIVLMVVFWSVQYAGVLCVVQCPCVLFVTVRHHYCTAAATLAPHSQVINRWEIYFNGECEIGIADWSMRNTMRFGITCQRRIWSCYWWRRDSVASASWYGGYRLLFAASIGGDGGLLSFTPIYRWVALSATVAIYSINSSILCVQLCFWIVLLDVHRQ